MECKEAKIFVTVSVDNEIHLTLDNEFGENQLLRLITLKEEHIASITHYIDYRFIIVGTRNGQIAIFEMDSGKLHASSTGSSYTDVISSLTFIEDLPFLVATYSSGKINFVATPPLLYKFTIVDSFLNLDSEEVI